MQLFAVTPSALSSKCRRALSHAMQLQTALRATKSGARALQNQLKSTNSPLEPSILTHFKWFFLCFMPRNAPSSPQKVVAPAPGGHAPRGLQRLPPLLAGRQRAYCGAEVETVEPQRPRQLQQQPQSPAAAAQRLCGPPRPQGVHGATLRAARSVAWRRRFSAAAPAQGKCL